jgi:flavin reductase (DIM6/NTAB) family NADH-FMN oxidoreductase RutF
VTIHHQHPFLPPEPEREPVRRMRGRLGGTVTLWTAGAGPTRAGLTVSSVMIAAGDPAHVVALVDPDSGLADVVADTGAAVVQLLEWPHRNLAEAFAGQAPAPGGPFTTGSWEDTDWGPRLRSASSWAGVRVTGQQSEVGWSLLVDGVIEHVEIGEEREPLVHRRGRYLRPPAAG